MAVRIIHPDSQHIGTGMEIRRKINHKSCVAACMTANNMTVKPHRSRLESSIKPKKEMFI